MATRIDNDIMKEHIGEIVCGSTHYGCTTPHFYRIVGLSGKRTVRLKRLHVVYDSKYGPNSPLYYCIPAECAKDSDKEWYDVTNDWQSREPETKVFIYEWNSGGNTRRSMYSNSTPILDFWDKTPQYGNCD